MKIDLDFLKKDKDMYIKLIASNKLWDYII